MHYSHLCRSMLLLACLLPLWASAAPSPADFAADHSFVDTELSPNGELLAVTIVHEGKRQLAIFRTQDKKMVGGAKFPGRQETGQAYWVNNERLVIKLLESEPWDEQPKFYGQLFAVDYNGKNGELIYGVGAGESKASRLRKKEDTFGWGDVISILPDDPMHILISSTPMSDGGERRATIHKLNVYDGKMSSALTRSPVSYARFITDGNGNLKIAFGRDAEGDRRTFRYENEQWTEISAEFGPGFYPLALNEAGDKLYYLDDPKKDLKGLFELDMLSGAKREIYTDDQVDITSVTYSSDGNSIYALRVDPDYPTYVMLNSSNPEAELYRQFLDNFPGYKISITSRSDDGRWWLLYASNDIDAGTYYLYDKEKHALRPMFANLSHLKAEQLSQSEPVSFVTSDKVTISGYLTYPQSVSNEQKVPLVVLVHGGPHGVRDYWSFDREVQLLASQGYAVLRVNFRGSDGYGRMFREAGHRQWGGLIMRDIIEGTRWAAGQERIDASKICIMGGSFGGYAAVQAAIVEPDLYRCVIGTVGVYDLPLMFEKGDIPELLYGESYLTDVLGKDEAQLRAFSPVYNADKLKAAIMIAHNKKDRRVPIEHAERLRDALDQADKPYEWFIKDTEAHGFSNAANRADYYQAVSQYLSKHLGG
ncbi:S9 family peptidase [Bowmanella sp. Y26]|uniref:alpha/beta hydrolase family protein n=1 Tax=Bowmanella yangjiangensis TaxID=2811230 RepID=UPI001BDDC669|nr:S9 family peptidase [Bowmanella yangjiangensis]MBT1064715.1 S9 family peptidase [Bowmanella yangjiangensis]